MLHLPLVLLAALSFCGSVPGVAQQPSGNTVTFHLNGGRVSPPVKVVQFTIDGKDIPFDTPVPVEAMWMKTLKVVIQNVSPKVIVKGGVQLWFPEDQAAKIGPIPMLVLNAGRTPKHALLRKDGTFQVLYGPQPAEIAINPGMTMTLTPFADSDDVERQAEGLAGHLSKVNVNFDTFYFTDDSKWMSDFYVAAVPPPEVWKKITPEQFFAGASEPER